MSWPLAARHGAVFSITCLAILISFFLSSNYLLPISASVVFCSWYFGRSAGLHSALAAALLAYLFLLSPRYSWSWHRPGVGTLAAFTVVAVALAFLTASLCASRDLQDSILGNMSDAVIVTDRRGVITYLNAAAESLSGFRAAEAKRQTFESIFPLRDEAGGEERASIIAKLLASGAVIHSGDVYTLLRSRDGAEYSVEESAAAIRKSNGRIAGAIVVLRNTTRRRRMQDQFTQSQKMEAIGRLAGGVAGDFNNLLTVITGYSELLTTEMAPANPLRRFAEEILRAAERAAELTRQLLWFGKGQAIRAKPRDLNTLVGNMETMLRRVLGSSIELILLPSAAPARINTDPGQIDQILANLAMNARDAMPTGGKFVIETSLIEVRRDSPGRLPDLPEGHHVMLAVSDTGIGMDAETRARLFEPFFTTKNQRQGSGLGLSIVYGIVQQHGGHISVYSQPSAGTIFEIYFPPAKDIAAPAPTLAAPRGTETILIVDDEDAVRKLIHAVLVQRGYTILEARDGREALDLFRANQDQIDLVLADVVMPRMNGYELGPEIAKLAPNKRVIFMSGYRDIQSAGENQPQHGLLNKPFTPEALLKQVRESLDRSEKT